MNIGSSSPLPVSALRRAALLWGNAWSRWMACVGWPRFRWCSATCATGGTPSTGARSGLSGSEVFQSWTGFSVPGTEARFPQNARFFFLLSGFVLSYAEMTRADAGSRAVPVLSRWEYTQRRLRRSGLGLEDQKTGNPPID